MVDVDLKKRILKNDFAFKIRHFDVNQQSFDDLCRLLTELAEVWKDSKEIDKEVAAELYGVFVIAVNTEKSLRVKNSPVADQVADMVQELDRLILNCLAL